MKDIDSLEVSDLLTNMIFSYLEFCDDKEEIARMKKELEELQ